MRLLNLSLFLCLLFVTLLRAEDSAVTAVVSSAAVPPGGTAQITLLLPSPLALVSGTLSLDLDASVFQNITAVNVFSASGDQVGVADIKGLHADVEFTSNSGGIGRLQDYPLLEITAPVLETAKPGSTGAIVVRSRSPWRDILGNQYSMSFQSPGIPVGNGISIQSVVPGGGAVPAGTQVQINGQGFTAATRLQLDTVAWSNLQFVSSHLLTFMLTGPADLTGKLIVLTDSNGAQARYYSYFTPVSVRRPASLPATIQPIFPQFTVTAAIFISEMFALENQTPAPADAVLTHVGIPSRPGMPPPVSTKTITVPAGGVYILDSGDLPDSSFDVSITLASAIRALSLCCVPNLDAGFFASAPTLPDPGALNAGGPVTWDLQPDDPPSAPTFLPSVKKDSVVTAGTDDGNPWLFAEPAPNGGGVQFRVDPRGLTLGAHKGVITIVPSGASVPQARINATLNIHLNPFIKGPDYVQFVFNTFPQSFTVTCDSGAVPIVVSSTDAWLSVTPASATTPATLTVSVDSSKLAGQTSKLGSITVQGPGNTLTIPVYLDLGSAQVVSPTDLTFSAGKGTTAPITTRVNVGPTIQPITFESSTDSGGPWLSAAMTNGPGVPGLAVSADPSGLGAGTYHGAITIHPTNPAGGAGAPISVSATLIVWTSPTPAPSVSPTSLELTAPSGRRTGYQSLTVSTGALPLTYSVTAQIDAGSNWLGVSMPGALYTPAVISVNAGAEALFPGVYHGRVIVTSPAGSSSTVIVPVTLTVTPGPAVVGAPPLISSIVNAASLLAGPISPGEIVTLFGIIAPDATSGVNLGRDGRVNTSSYGNRVLFNGIAAPLVFMSPTQISAVVPYEISGSSVATVELDMSSIHSPAWSVPVAASAPGVFTQAGTGQGSAAILNVDNSLNTPSNPAAPGSIIQIYATGEGQTSPPGVTGEVTQSDIKPPLLRPSVQIGGVDATITSATTAPQAIAGLFQINVQIPSSSPSGSIPVVLRIGSASSQASATVSVR